MATYYFRNVGIGWNTASNWSTSSGGTANGSIPAGVDDAVFDINSTNCTLSGTAGVCRSLNFSSYVNTFTLNTNLTVSGSVTLGSGMTMAGTSALILPTSSILTGNNKIWTGDLTTIGSSNNITLSGSNWIVGGNTLFSSSTATATTHVINSISNEQLECRGNITFYFANTSGSSTILLSGTGTVSANNVSTGIYNNLSINTTGSITLGTNFSYGSGSFNYFGGAVIASGNTTTFRSSCNISSSGMIWGNIGFNNNPVITLLSPLSASAINIVSSIYTGATFTGSYGWTVTSYIDNRGPSTMSLSSGVTYRVNNTLGITGWGNTYYLLKSTIPNQPATLILNQSAVQSVSLVSASDIDSSLGQTIFNFKGYNTGSTNNWYSFSRIGNTTVNIY